MRNNVSKSNRKIIKKLIKYAKYPEKPHDHPPNNKISSKAVDIAGQYICFQ